MHGELIEEVYKRILNHQFLELVLDDSTDSLMILDSSQNIKYTNPSFRKFFHKAIRYAKKKSRSEENSEARLVQ